MLRRPLSFFTHRLQANTRPFASIISKKLIKVIDKSIDEEFLNYKPDDAVNLFVHKSGFDLIDNENTTLVFLKKKTQDFDIEIQFEAKMPEPDIDKEIDEEVGEEIYEETVTVNFQIVLKKPDRKEGLIYECYTRNAEIWVENIVVTDDVDNTERVGTGPNKEMYRGPGYFTLDEMLQSAINDHFRSLGINEDVGIFIETYAFDKEHRLYLDWLQKIKEFVSS